MTDARESDASGGIGDLKRVGGHPTLDFCNTTDSRGTETPGERLRAYADLLEWSVGAGILADRQAGVLSDRAAADPAAAEAALRRALDLRETLYRILSAAAAGTPGDENDLASLNARVGTTLGRLRLRPEADGYAWAWEDQTGSLEGMLWPVVRGAAELLTSDELGRLKICPRERCGWLFLDRSRNRSRRWCDMRECGNVVKARRYRRRHGTSE